MQVMIEYEDVEVLLHVLLTTALTLSELQLQARTTSPLGHSPHLSNQLTQLKADAIKLCCLNQERTLLTVPYLKKKKIAVIRYAGFARSSSVKSSFENKIQH
jgi:hypothetical protein